jgi:large subunit ribosomal protein L23
MKDATEVIIQPLLTEKSVGLQRLGKYTFKVAIDATKIEIEKAIQALGRCEVEKVNTIVVKGKIRRTRRGTGRTPDWKKAVVTLKEGQALGGVLGQAFEAV